MSMSTSISSFSNSSLSPVAAVSIAALGAEDRSEARTAGAAGGLGIPTVITDNKKREKALQVVDSEGEIAFFDRKTFKPLFDDDAEKIQRWLMLRQAQQILLAGDSFELRDKHDLLPYSPLHFPGFVGPFKIRHTRSPRLVEVGRKYSPFYFPGFVGPVKVALQADHELVQHLQPKFRTVLCLQRHVPGRDASVWQSRETTNCSWHDVTVCGSPWTCPLCSARINYGRQDQINRIYEAVKSHTVGGGAYMLTFTVRHGLGDDCKLLVDSMKQAMQLLQKTFEWKSATRRKPLTRPRAGSIPFLDYIGRIAALEATHGANGWHPHEHHLWFFKQKLSPQKINILKRNLFKAWSDCCVAAGMQAPLEKFGLDIREALSAAEYISKFSELGFDRRWGPEKEIASSHSKKGNRKGRSVMQILSDSMGLNDGVDSSQSDFSLNSDSRLFFDFAHAFLGKHQLQMSRTLKKWLREFGVDIDETEAGDLELAQALESDSQMQFEVDAADFRCIVKNKAQAAVLLMCKKMGVEAALEFIKFLPGRIEVEKEAVEFVRDVDLSGVHYSHEAGAVVGLMKVKKPVFQDDVLPLLDTRKHDLWLKGRDLDYWQHFADDPVFGPSL